MKAAILVKQKKPLVIADINLPQSLHYGQVLVKVVYSSICGAQINEIDGVKGEDKFLPHLLGHEGGGIVEKIGSGVLSVKVGDHVVMHWKKGIGIQSETPIYSWGEKKVNAGWVTTFNQYAVVSENRLTAIDKSIDLQIASLYGCAITTGFGVIQNDADLKSGESIIIFGSGGAGMAVILAASIVSAYPIIAVDINDFKLKIAKYYGATHTINSKKKNIKQELRRFINLDKADAVVDTTGINEVRELAYELTSDLGRTILVGVPKKGDKISINSFPLHFDKKITGSFGGDSYPTYDIPRLLRLQQSGRYNLDKMITKIYALKNINNAIDDVRTGDVIRCLIKM